MPNFCMVWGRVMDLKVHDKAITFRIADKRKGRDGEDIWTNVSCLCLSATDWQKSTIQEGKFLGFTGRFEDQKGKDGKIYKNLIVESIKFMGEPRVSGAGGSTGKQDDDFPF